MERQFTKITQKKKIWLAPWLVKKLKLYQSTVAHVYSSRYPRG
jgi:hypothetical protein